MKIPTTLEILESLYDTNQRKINILLQLIAVMENDPQAVNLKDYYTLQGQLEATKSMQNLLYIAIELSR